MCTAVHFNCPNTHAQFLQNNLIFLLLNWPILGRTFRLHWFGQSRVNCTLCLPHIPNVRGSISFIVGDSRTQRIPVPWLRIWWKSKHGKVRSKSSTRRLHCRKCSDMNKKKLSDCGQCSTASSKYASEPMQIRYHGLAFMLNPSNPWIDSEVDPTDPKNIICEQFFILIHS